MFENVPKGWKSNKLEPLITYYIGGDWGEENFLTDDYTPVKIIRATDFSQWNKKNGLNAQIRYLKKSSLEKRKLLNNDIVIEISGGSPDQPVGRTIIIKNDKFLDTDYSYSCSNFFRLLRINENEIIPDFLNYYFKILYETRTIEQYQSNSTNLRNLKFKQFLSQEIYYPSDKNEQEEIVKVLDMASDMVRLRKECIASAQSLIPAIFQEMFGDVEGNKNNYPIQSIRNVSEINPAKTILKDEDEVTFLGMKDISENGLVDLSTIKLYEEVKKGFTNFKNNDVLLAKITPCFENGKAAVVKNLINGLGFGSTEFYVIRPDQNKILPEYLYSVIKSRRFAALGKMNMKGAAGQKRLVKEFVLNYKFPKAPMKQQEQFAQKAQEIEEYIKQQQEELKQSEALFQSLLHHAFTGELTKHKFGEING